MRLTVKEQILDWFDYNPGSKARSGPLAKALKIGSTSCADALAKLAAEGKLSRVKTKIDEGTGQGSRPEQWEYSIPAPETVAQPRTPTPFKPLGAQPRVYRRHSPIIENAPSVMAGPVHAPAQTIQEPQPDEMPGRDVTAAHPTEHLADHIKARLERAESDLESMASAARKFCAWVAEEFPASQFPLNLYECQQVIKQALERSDNNFVELTQKANEAQARADDLEAKALGQYQAVLDEFHIESPARLRIKLEMQKAQGQHIAELTAKTPEAYAVAAPKKPLQRFTARHNAEKAATAAARTVGSAEIYELHRIARASRGAVVIQEG